MGGKCCKCSSGDKNVKPGGTSQSSGSSVYAPTKRAKGSRQLAGERYRIGENNNAVHLTLQGITREDEGEYTVTAKNIAGESRSAVYLRIKDGPYEEDEAPIFLRRLNDLAVKVGTRTRFLVEIRTSSDVKVTWNRNDVPIPEEDRFHFLHEGNFFCVDVAPVTVEDGGRWSCVAENRTGRSSCSSKLNVLIPKAYKAPEFLEELKAVLTDQGTVSLECKVVGVPTPVLKWYKDKKEIRPGDMFALTANQDDPTSLGMYTCEAINCMGKAYSSSRVHVSGRGSREGSFLSTDTHFATGTPPQFKKELKSEKVKIGSSLLLTCQVTVPPWPKSINWYNKQGKIEPCEKYHIMEDGLGGYSIEIFPLDSNDEGEWKCVATSDTGVISITKCDISMTYPKNYRKPKFLESLKAILTEEGLVSFECKVVGFPTPRLQWFKDGQELRPGDVYQLTGTNSLGSYSCVARNCMGEAKSSAELTVEDIQSQLNEEERLHLFSKNQPPRFIRGLKSCEAKINEDFRYTVQVTLSPEVNLSWYRDDEAIENSERYSITKESTGVCHLDIKKLEVNDQAEWKCVASNEFGQSITTGFLKLTIPKHYKKPKFLECLRAILSEEGAVNLECKVIGVPQPMLKWYKDGKELKPGDIHRIVSGQDGKCCLGTYTCEARNCMGTASSSASLLGFEDRKAVKEIPKGVPESLYQLAKNTSLSTIHEERTSQLYDTPGGEQSISMDERGDFSFSFDGKEVSISLYETPDLTEEEALQVVEMYAEELSEHISEQNVVELPPMRFTKESSKSGPLLMEAVVIDVSEDYFSTAEDDLRTEADFEDVSMAEEVPQILPAQEIENEAFFEKITSDYLEKVLAPLSGHDQKPVIRRSSTDSKDRSDSFKSFSSPKKGSVKGTHSDMVTAEDDSKALGLGSARGSSDGSNASLTKEEKTRKKKSRSSSIDRKNRSFEEKVEEGVVTITPKRTSISRSSSGGFDDKPVRKKTSKSRSQSQEADEKSPKKRSSRSASESLDETIIDSKKISRARSQSDDSGGNETGVPKKKKKKAERTRSKSTSQDDVRKSLSRQNSTDHQKKKKSSSEDSLGKQEEMVIKKSATGLDSEKSPTENASLKKKKIRSRSSSIDQSKEGREKRKSSEKITRKTDEKKEKGEIPVSGRGENPTSQKESKTIECSLKEILNALEAFKQQIMKNDTENLENELINQSFKEIERGLGVVGEQVKSEDVPVLQDTAQSFQNFRVGLKFATEQKTSQEAWDTFSLVTKNLQEQLKVATVKVSKGSATLVAAITSLMKPIEKVGKYLSEVTTPERIESLSPVEILQNLAQPVQELQEALEEAKKREIQKSDLLLTIEKPMKDLQSVVSFVEQKAQLEIDEEDSVSEKILKKVSNPIEKINEGINAIKNEASIGGEIKALEGEKILEKMSRSMNELQRGLAEVVQEVLFCPSKEEKCVIVLQDVVQSISDVLANLKQKDSKEVPTQEQRKIAFSSLENPLTNLNDSFAMVKEILTPENLDQVPPEVIKSNVMEILKEPLRDLEQSLHNIKVELNQTLDTAQVNKENIFQVLKNMEEGVVRLRKSEQPITEVFTFLLSPLQELKSNLTEKRRIRYPLTKSSSSLGKSLDMIHQGSEDEKRESEETKINLSVLRPLEKPLQDLEEGFSLLEHHIFQKEFSGHEKPAIEGNLQKLLEVLSQSFEAFQEKWVTIEANKEGDASLLEANALLELVKELKNGSDTIQNHLTQLENNSPDMRDLIEAKVSSNLNKLKMSIFQVENMIIHESLQVVPEFKNLIESIGKVKNNLSIFRKQNPQSKKIFEILVEPIIDIHENLENVNLGEITDSSKPALDEVAEKTLKIFKEKLNEAERSLTQEEIADIPVSQQFKELKNKVGEQLIKNSTVESLPEITRLLEKFGEEIPHVDSDMVSEQDAVKEVLSLLDIAVIELSQIQHFEVIEHLKGPFTNFRTTLQEIQGKGISDQSSFIVLKNLIKPLNDLNEGLKNVSMKSATDFADLSALSNLISNFQKGISAVQQQIALHIDDDGMPEHTLFRVLQVLISPLHKLQESVTEAQRVMNQFNSGSIDQKITSLQDENQHTLKEYHKNKIDAATESLHTLVQKAGNIPLTTEKVENEVENVSSLVEQGVKTMSAEQDIKVKLPTKKDDGKKLLENVVKKLQEGLESVVETFKDERHNLVLLTVPLYELGTALEKIETEEDIVASENVNKSLVQLLRNLQELEHKDTKTKFFLESIPEIKENATTFQQLVASKETSGIPPEERELLKTLSAVFHELREAVEIIEDFPLSEVSSLTLDKSVVEGLAKPIQNIQHKLAEINEHCQLEKEKSFANPTLKTLAKPVQKLQDSVAVFQQQIMETASINSPVTLEQISKPALELSRGITQIQQQLVLFSEKETDEEVVKLTAKLIQEVALEIASVQEQISMEPHAISVSDKSDVSILKTLAKPALELQKMIALVHQCQFIEPEAESLASFRDSTFAEPLENLLNELQQLQNVILEGTTVAECLPILTAVAEPVRELHRSFAIMQSHEFTKDEASVPIADFQIMEKLASPIQELASGLIVVQQELAEPSASTLSQSFVEPSSLLSTFVKPQDLQKMIAIIQQCQLIEPTPESLSSARESTLAQPLCSLKQGLNQLQTLILESATLGECLPTIRAIAKPVRELETFIAAVQSHEHFVEETAESARITDIITKLATPIQDLASGLVIMEQQLVESDFKSLPGIEMTKIDTQRIHRPLEKLFVQEQIVLDAEGDTLSQFTNFEEATLRTTTIKEMMGVQGETVQQNEELEFLESIPAVAESATSGVHGSETKRAHAELQMTLESKVIETVTVPQIEKEYGVIKTTEINTELKTQDKLKISSQKGIDHESETQESPTSEYTETLSEVESLSSNEEHTLPKDELNQIRKVETSEGKTESKTISAELQRGKQKIITKQESLESQITEKKEPMLEANLNIQSQSKSGTKFINKMEDEEGQDIKREKNGSPDAQETDLINSSKIKTLKQERKDENIHQDTHQIKIEQTENKKFIQIDDPNNRNDIKTNKQELEEKREKTKSEEKQILDNKEREEIKLQRKEKESAKDEETIQKNTPDKDEKEQARLKAEKEINYERNEEAKKLKESQARVKKEENEARERQEETVKIQTEKTKTKIEKEEAESKTQEEANKNEEKEAKKKKDEDEAKKKNEEEEAKKKKEEEETKKKKADDEAKKMKEEDEAKKKKDKEETKKQKEEEKAKAKPEIEDKKKEEEDETKAKTEIEAKKKKEEEETKKKKDEEEAKKKKMEEEAKKKKEEEEAKKKKEEEEAKKIKEEEEAKKKKEEEETRKKKEEEEAKVKAEIEAKKKKEEEEAKKKKEEEETKKKKADDEAKKKKEEEEAKAKAEIEAKKKREEEETKKKKKEEEAKKKKEEEEAKKKKEEEEAKKIKEEEEAKKKKEEEETRKKKEEEEAKVKAEIEAKKKKEEEEAKAKADIETKKKKEEEEAKKKKEEDEAKKKKEEEEAKAKVEIEAKKKKEEEEAKAKTEIEAKKMKEEEEAKKKKEEEAKAKTEIEAKEMKEEEEAKKKKEEDEAKKKKEEEEAKAKAEIEAKKKKEEDEAKKKKEEEEAKKKKEEEEAKKKKEEEETKKRKADDEAKVKAEIEAKKKKEEEEAKKKKEEDEAKKKNEEEEAKKKNEEEEAKKKKEEEEAQKKKEEEEAKKKKEEEETKKKKEEEEAAKKKKEEEETKKKKEEEEAKKKKEEEEAKKKKKEEEEAKKKKEEDEAKKKKDEEEAKAKAEIEAKKKKEEEEAKKKKDEEEAKKRKEEEEAKKKKEKDEAKKKNEEEEAKKKKEEEETKKKKEEEEAKKKKEEEEAKKKKVEEEAKKKKEEEEAKKKKEEEETKKKKEEEEAAKKKKMEEEAKKKKEEEEAKKKKEEEEAKKKKEEEEAKKKKEEEEAKKKKEEEETRKKKEEEEAKVKAEIEAKKKKEEEEAKKKKEEDEAKKKNEEEEAKKKKEEEEAKKKKEEEEAKKKKEEEEAKKKKEEEEAKKKKEEEEAKKKKDEEAKKRKEEEEAKAKADIETKKKKEEEEAKKKKEEDEAKKKNDEEEAKAKTEIEAKKKKEEEEAKKKKEEEETRKKKEEEEAKVKAEIEAKKKKEDQAKAEVNDEGKKKKEEVQSKTKKKKKLEEEEEKEEDGKAEEKTKKLEDEEGKSKAEEKAKKVDEGGRNGEETRFKNRVEESNENKSLMMETEDECMNLGLKEQRGDLIMKAENDYSSNYRKANDNFERDAKVKSKIDGSEIEDTFCNTSYEKLGGGHQKRVEFHREEKREDIGLRDETRRRKEISAKRPMDNFGSLLETVTETTAKEAETRSKSIVYGESRSKFDTQTKIYAKREKAQNQSGTTTHQTFLPTIETTYSRKLITTEAEGKYKFESEGGLNYSSRVERYLGKPLWHALHKANYGSSLVDISSYRQQKKMRDIKRIDVKKIHSASLDDLSLGLSSSDYYPRHGREIPREKKGRPMFCSRLVDCTAPRGTNIKLTCTVLGNPEPEVKWLRDGLPLFMKPGDKYTAKTRDGFATLEIEGATQIDNGEYTCLAVNDHGEETTSCKLKIFEGYDPAPFPPTFTTSLKDTYKFTEDKLIIQCRVRSHPPPSVQWLRNGVPIRTGNKYQQTEMFDGVCQLIIFNPEIEDSGDYTCKAENQVAEDSITRKVKFFGRSHYAYERKSVARSPKDFRKPHFRSELSDYIVPSGGTIALQVEVRGTPIPEVKWLRGKEELPRSSSKVRFFEDEGVHTLIVSNASESEAGIYSCHAYNAFGHIRTTAAVEVLPMTTIRGGKPPKIVNRPKDIMSANVDDDVIITCRITGEPKPRVSWMKGTKDITITQRTMVDHTDDYYRFTMKRVVAADAGTYWIIAKNVHGHDRAFVTLQVKERARSLSPGGFSFSKWDWTAPPTDSLKILSLIHDREKYNKRETPGPIGSEPYVSESGRNRLTLSWNKPSNIGGAPVIAYRVDAWELGQDGGARWTELGITPGNTFDAFNLKQGKQYKFRITPRNRYGWGEPLVTSCPINVGYETIHLPEFTKILPGQLKGLLGSSIGLECHVSSDTRPQINWYRDGIPVDFTSPKMSHSFEGNVCRLVISNLAESDSGRYMCEAINKIGRVSTFARLMIVSDPKVWEADARLKWGVFDEDGIKPDSPPQFTMRLRDRRVQMTYPVRLTCQIIGSPAPQVKWYHEGEEVAQDDRHTFSSEDHFHTLEMSKAMLEDAGCYMATAWNDNGSVSCRCNLVVDKGIRAYIAPEFVHELEVTKIVRTGNELRLIAQVEAYPSVGIVWHRNGVRLRPSRRIIMNLSHDGTIELVIAQVTERDSGVYICTAANEVGRCESACRVNVQSGISDTIPQIRDDSLPYSKSPIFLKKPRSNEAVEGDTVVIECQVIGDPTPEVFWLRDFLKPDYYRDAPSFRREGEGPDYRLEIAYAKLDHTGTYSVVARNVHGEVKTVTSLQIYAKGQGKEDTMDNNLVPRGKAETLPRFSKELKDIRCCDGDAVTFECTVEAAGPLEVTWKKAGKLVRLGGDFAAKFDGTVAKLIINQVYPEDEGEYTCEVRNNILSISTSACLVVDVPEEKENLLSGQLHRPSGLMSSCSTPRSTPRTTPTRSVSPYPPGFRYRSTSPGNRPKRLKVRPPKFYAVPHNRIAQEGETVRFQCSVGGHPAPWVSWDKDGLTVTPTARITMSEKEDLKVLEISEVTPEDAGLYRIVVENEVGRIEATARLDVIGPHSYKSRVGNSMAWSASPTFRKRLVRSVGRIGENITLSCDIKSSPSPITSWYRNGEYIVRTNKFTPTWDGETAELKIENLEMEDAGLYTCVAENKFGTSQCSAALVIEKDDNALKEAPILSQHLNDASTEEGCPAEFLIHVQGDGPVDIVWFKDNKQIPDCNDFRYVDYGDGRYGLRIADAFPEDSGEYSCEVYNQYGHVTSSARLWVQDNAANTAPKLIFSKKPTSAVVASGGSVSFCCRVQPSTANLPVFISWFTTGRIVSKNSSGKYLIEEDGDVSILHITSVDQGDAGQIVCTATYECPLCSTKKCICSNSSVSCAAELIVLSDNWASDSECVPFKCREKRSRSLSTGEIKADLPKMSKDNTGYSVAKESTSRALILRGPTDQNVFRGVTAVLTAAYCGQPEPNVRWMKGGQRLENCERIKIKTENGVTSLTIDAITSDDSGKYVVLVENDHGSDRHFASLAVEGPPDPPSLHPTVDGLSLDSARVEWTSPAFDGGCKIISYVIEMKSKSEPQWKVVSTVRDSFSHIVRYLKPNEKYKFRVRAENVHGRSEPSSESNELHLNDVRYEFSQCETRRVTIEDGDLFKARFEVQEELGKGRFGIVHKVADVETSQKFAAKFIRCITVRDREKVKEEIEIMNCLRHPKLLQLTAAFESPREIVMVTEYISGGELFERVVADDFQLTERDCILFMRQICEGVRYMHENSVVHLDLKPENIMCQTRISHEIKLIDFGLAQKIDPDNPIRVLFGTPEFVPPEVINYEPIGFESDMWSVGVICYVLLSGLSPFMGENDAETFANITRASYDFDEEAFSTISQDAKDFISALLVKRKEKRLTASQCLRNKWMLSEHDKTMGVILSTDKLKKFIIRRKWQKTGNAIRALGRLATLSAASRKNSGSNSCSTSSRPVSNNSNGDTKEESKQSLDACGNTSSPSAMTTSVKTDADYPKIPQNSKDDLHSKILSEKRDSGISDCSSLSARQSSTISPFRPKINPEVKELSKDARVGGQNFSNTQTIEGKVDAIRKKFANLSKNIDEMDKKLETVGRKLVDIGPGKLSQSSRPEIKRVPSLKESKPPDVKRLMQPTASSQAKINISKSPVLNRKENAVGLTVPVSPDLKTAKLSRIRQGTNDFENTKPNLCVSPTVKRKRFEGLKTHSGTEQRTLLAGERSEEAPLSVEDFRPSLKKEVSIKKDFIVPAKESSNIRAGSLNFQKAVAFWKSVA